MSKQNWNKLPLLTDYLDLYAQKHPDKTAIIQSEDGKEVSYKKLKTLTEFFALRLMSLGLKKGDIVATQLALFPEHVALMYACSKLGVIFAPIDLRLKKEEVKRDLDKIKPKMFFVLGKTPLINFHEIAEHIRDNCTYIQTLVQVIADPTDKPVNGAITIQQLMAKPKLVGLKLKDIFTGALKKAAAQVTTHDAAVIIFTTGTTGSPKPAMLSHENIIVQNEILSRGGNFNHTARTLVNLPPSHVGCVTETLLTTLFKGGTVIMLKVFDVKESLRAIQEYNVTLLGQIPTQFRLMWAQPDYDQYNLSSLEFAAYGGSAVDVEFLKKLQTMAPAFGTGMGMTETAGFSTFTPAGISVEEMAGQVGHFFEDLAVMSIRKPMNSDGTAGQELPDGEVGEICYHPPLVFMGYYQMPEQTAKAISKEGILYSGDVGYFKDMGTYRALYLAGRKKFIIKQKGYQVFPDEVQAFIAQHPKVDQVDVVGVKHKIFDEGIFAFVKPKANVELKPLEIMEHCKNIAAYKRPQHVELWPADEPFPITRTTKIDKLILQQKALEVVEKLRQNSLWDETPI